VQTLATRSFTLVVEHRFATRAAPTVGGITDQAAKRARKVRLVAHPTAQSDRTQLLIGHQQQSLRHFNPPLQDPGARGDAESQLEHPAKVESADS
jgi:hypothetical protein